MNKLFSAALLGFAVLIFGPAQAQLKNNQSLFDPLFEFQGNPYRSASGVPGEAYWQNAVNYEIDVALDEENDRVSGRISIDYTNNSPHTLDYIWLQLDQNRFAPDSRGTLTQQLSGGNSRFRGEGNGGYELDKVQVSLGTANGYEPKYFITDTRMQVRLREPLAAKGGTLKLSMDFSYVIPEFGADRMGRTKTKDGVIYQMAQWYPRIAVYDDIKGWNIEPYLGQGEFYCEYGDFVYRVTVPYDHIVVGSGELTNPEKVLTKSQLDRLARAKKSDQTVAIVGVSEVGDAKLTRPSQSGTLTWEFKMENSRDIAWASSKAFVWDAARINLPDGKTALAQSAYPPEVSSRNGWGRSTEYTKFSIEHYSEKWYPYPYPAAVNVAGRVAGMEYPGVSFCGWRAQTASLWGVTDHEFGHNWFPMIVGSNERLYPWMDEGFNTFINEYSTLEFNKGEYKNYAQLSSTLGRSYFTRSLKSPRRESISTYPDIVQSSNLGVTAYFKPAVGLMLLREVIIGPERFDYAFKYYIQNWAFKHPTPVDFFNCMESAAGEELNWFWRGWFYSTGNIDQGIKNVEYRDKGKSESGAIITIENKGEVLMPVKLEVLEKSGKTTIVDLPVEIWQRGNVWPFRFASESEIEKITIDPGKVYPDVNRKDNVWNAVPDQG